MSEAIIDSGTPTVVQAERILADDWQRFVPADSGDALPAAGTKWLVPVATWLAHDAALRARGEPVGILIAPADDVMTLEGRLDGVSVVAVDFPAFADGRGFSSGRLLRTRLGWTGELRAVGDVLIDTVFYLSRCGFDSFAVKPGHDPALAQQQLQAFSVNYQPNYRQPAGEAA
ncbi:DUF934 domain-containing protein [Achromobacter sp. GG226]|uniref:DUF934 domain-containing protein n=1 Tax=Verticiella alkaliphila TaxID=2779529 RepID=UPI001C0CAEB3|nr:DUF934 domain-containing protein [Verticiella sp. GG226]MBU4610228.1 DUF934 domain-containing protein [Verticiella sp. GG226]